MQSAEGPQAPPLLLHNSLRLREGNARELLPSAGYRLEALGARKADRLHCVAARDARQFTHARGTAAAAALAQLGRALGLAAREQQVAAEVRDFMSRQIAEHSARYATASARCENLVLAAERMDQQHLAVLEERDNHRRKLVMNARRLKQSCDAELGKMRRTLETKHDTMEVHQRAAKESEIPNFKGSYLGRFPLVLADFWTSDHLSERPRSVDAFPGTRARGTLTLKRR